MSSLKEVVVSLVAILFIVTFLKIEQSNHATYKRFLSQEEFNYTDDKQKYVAFYNIYTQGKHYKEIVEEQIKYLTESGILSILDKVYYFTIGKNNKLFSIHHPKFVKLGGLLTGYESFLLKMLKNFCLLESSSRVLYIHSKGSYHNKPNNIYLRRLLGLFTMNKGCVQALDKYDTCGARFSLLPAPHYPGNFWWAKCNYISTLVDPLSMEYNATVKKLTDELYKGYNAKPWVYGAGRYFSEHWIGTGIKYSPADCMSYEYDTNWFAGSNQAPRLNLVQLRKNRDQFFCGNATMIKNSEHFVKAFSSNFSTVYSVKMLNKRSMIWYRNVSIDLIKWRNNLGEKT